MKKHLPTWGSGPSSINPAVDDVRVGAHGRNPSPPRHRDTKKTGSARAPALIQSHVAPSERGLECGLLW